MCFCSFCFFVGGELAIKGGGTLYELVKPCLVKQSSENVLCLARRFLDFWNGNPSEHYERSQPKVLTEVLTIAFVILNAENFAIGSCGILGRKGTSVVTTGNSRNC